MFQSEFKRASSLIQYRILKPNEYHLSQINILIGFIAKYE